MGRLNRPPAGDGGGQKTTRILQVANYTSKSTRLNVKKKNNNEDCQIHSKVSHLLQGHSSNSCFPDLKKNHQQNQLIHPENPMISPPSKLPLGMKLMERPGNCFRSCDFPRNFCFLFGKVAGPRNNESDVLNSCRLDKAKYHAQRMFEVDKVYNAVRITNKHNIKKKGSGIAQE